MSDLDTAAGRRRSRTARWRTRTSSPPRAPRARRAADAQHRAAPPRDARRAAAAEHARGRGRPRHQADHRLRPHRHREDGRGQGLLEGHPGRRADGLPRVLLQRDGVLRGGRDAARPRGAAARAVPARHPPRAQPDHVPPRVARDERAGPRRDLDVLVLLPRARARSSTCSRCPPASACTRATSRSAASSRTSPPASWRSSSEFTDAMPDARRPVRRAARQERDRPAAPAQRRRPSTRRRCSASASPARCCAPTGNPWDLRKAAPVLVLRRLRVQDPGRHGRRQLRPLHGPPGRDEGVGADHRAGARRACPRARTSPTNRKVALPPRHELATSMEALIHHFKLVTEGFRVPPGEVYYPIESPRGELGCFVRSDGSSKPARVHMRDPSFVNLQALKPMVQDAYIADLIATLAMLDPVLGGHRPVDGDRSRAGHALRARLARPGLGRGRRPHQGPGGRPRPRDDAGARRRCAPRSRRYMAQVPRPRSAVDPGAARRAALPRLVLADGDRAGRVRDAPDARLPDRGRDLLRHVRDRARRASTRSTSARTSRARCAAPTRIYEAMQDAAGDDPRLQRARLRVPRRLRHRADGVGQRRLRRPARADDDCRDARRATCCAGRATPLPDKQPRAPRRGRAETLPQESRPSEAALRGHRRARPQHARRLRAPRRLRDARARRWR